MAFISPVERKGHAERFAGLEFPSALGFALLIGAFPKQFWGSGLTQASTPPAKMSQRPRMITLLPKIQYPFTTVAAQSSMHSFGGLKTWSSIQLCLLLLSLSLGRPS